MLRTGSMGRRPLWKLILGAILLGTLIGVGATLTGQWIGFPINPAIAGVIAGIAAGIYAAWSRA